MTETLTTEQVEKILADCGGVTPGPWTFTGLEMTANGLKIVDCLWGSKTSDGVATYRHIARLDPQTVSSLATELLALRKRVGELEGALKPFHTNEVIEGADFGGDEEDSVPPATPKEPS